MLLLVLPVAALLLRAMVESRLPPLQTQVMGAQLLPLQAPMAAVRHLLP